MPSEDTFHSDRPETNGWLGTTDSLPTFGTPPGSESTSARARDVSRTEQAARVQALAAVTGQDAEALASRIPEDTLRRLKYPVIEQVEPDGTSRFKHDLGIVRDARTPLLAGDRADAAIEKGSGGKGAGVGPMRDERSGKFTK